MPQRRFAGTLTPCSSRACPLLSLWTTATANRCACSRLFVRVRAPATLTGARVSSTLCAPSRALFAVKKRRTGKKPAAAPTASRSYPSQLHSPATPATPASVNVSAPASSSAEKADLLKTTSAAAQQMQPQPQRTEPMRSPSTERSSRRYSIPSTVTDHQVQQLKHELLHTRLRLAKAEQTKVALYEGVLAKLDETDRAAQQTAASLRYTGMALRCAHDNFEVELRRLMTIGLTAGEVDAAAIEAGARQYIRQNIGFHEEHVASEPASVTDILRESQKNARPDAR
ncbi:hypothetical protein ABL78_7121 [Leptomonas seymouri]|uniref:Uncharacterized protein n=1 Tax=Leptomonas seymouri TaxID=5684 RepID=A0A0N0P384_LEPSE|nr:hypothetical protein ABL78_7121 [Leptomonas seymouri]|eukprot:KPI83836.1 hypothetical protein ABL78_7121 [Leptomonas seymouri]